MKARKLFCTLTIAVLAISVAGAAWAAGFSKAELKKMSTFLSNFTEVGLFTFDVDYGGDPDVIHVRNPKQIGELIHFGVWHNYINNYKSRIKMCNCEYGGCSIQGKFVVEAVKKYFDLDIKPQSVTEPMNLHYDSKKGMYHFDGADGEYTLYADVQKATKNKNGSITMTGELYNIEDKTDRPATFTATAKPYKWAGKNTWSILSMTTTSKTAPEPRKEAEPEKKVETKKVPKVTPVKPAPKKTSGSGMTKEQISEKVLEDGFFSIDAWERETKEGHEVFNIEPLEPSNMTWTWELVDDTDYEKRKMLDSGTVTDFDGDRLVLTGKSGKKYFATVKTVKEEKLYFLKNLYLYTDGDKFVTFTYEHNERY